MCVCVLRAVKKETIAILYCTVKLETGASVKRTTMHPFAGLLFIICCSVIKCLGKVSTNKGRYPSSKVILSVKFIDNNAKQVPYIRIR